MSVFLAANDFMRHISVGGNQRGMVMRINWKILLQIAIATAVALGVTYLQRRAGGPGGGIVPGLLAFVISWLVIPAVSNDIGRIRRWLGHSPISAARQISTPEA